MKRNRIAAFLAALTLVVSVVAIPGVVAAADELAVTVEQQAETGEALVSVTDGGDAVENATVVVEADSSYDGNGTYETDGDGTVTLPNPDESVTVTLDVSTDGANQTVESELVPREDSLAVDVDGGVDENATVTVTQYGDPVENASLSVDGDDYAGNGTYETDENGTVELVVPDEQTEVTLNASSGDLTAERTVTLGEAELELDVEQDDDGVTVEVERNDSGVEGANVTVEAVDDESYVDEGEYETDEDGTVGLSTPEQTVEVTITATDGGETVSENVTLENETTTYPTFGAELSAYVQQLLSGASGGIGDDVSEFAQENNPGNAGEAGDADEEDDGDERGPDEVPGKGDEMRDERGGDDDSDSDEENDDEADEENDDEADEENDDEADEENDDAEDDDDSAGNGPPSHANN